MNYMFFNKKILKIPIFTFLCRPFFKDISCIRIKKDSSSRPAFHVVSKVTVLSQVFGTGKLSFNSNRKLRHHLNPNTIAARKIRGNKH